MRVARLYGVGVGPGDPELLTLKARRILESVPVWFYPEGGGGGLARRIAAGAARPPARQVGLPCLSGADGPARAAGWRENARRVAAVLAEHGEGAYVTEGDPLLYSTFRHLWRALEAVAPDVEVRVVPGVPAFLAAAAEARLPLVAGTESLVLLPAARLADGEGLGAQLAAHRTLAVYKVARRYGALLDELATLDAEAVLAERVGLPGAFVGPPEAGSGRPLDYFSLLLVRRRGE